MAPSNMSKPQMKGVWLGLLAMGIGASVMGSRPAGQVGLPSGQIHHDTGQNVAPVYEGWYTAPDGTTRVLFGYLNKNYKEEVGISVGPNNKIEPGKADSGQPTHFLPRRQYGVFAITLPRDQPKVEFTWTLTIRGRSESVPATLNPVYVINALKHVGGTEDGATPPILRFSTVGAPGFGPAGIRTSLKASVSQPVALDVWVADETATPSVPGRGPMPSAPSSRARPPLKVAWQKFRGSGSVVFGNSAPPIQDGKASTVATFSERGDYTLRVVAFRGAGVSGQCCWTNGYLDVSVDGTPSIRR
jgi:hypothetical protein